ncbi:MAG: capsule assembly Wzi family protein [Pseudomonadota bacterium]
MKKKFLHILLMVLHTSSTAGYVHAQQVVIGTPEEDSIRMAQLAGNYDPNVSMAVRPLYNQQSATDKKFQLKPLPLSFTMQYNSQRPFGWNDGSMILARGLQTQLRAGVYMRMGIVELQLAPEWIYAANPSYDTSVHWGTNPGGAYNKFFLGQSSVGIRLGGVSVGLSSQNLWWGPGIRSSLLMSNNAPGFLHAYIRSNRPIKTPIGHFEWQLIGGRLEGDSTRPYENFHLKRSTQSYPATWRYQSAFVISYQPKWVPGLFLGMTRTLQRFQQDIGLGGGGFLQQYIPVLTKAFQKKNALTDDAENTDQLASFFFRWLLPKSGLEVYGEWGYNDYKQNIRDYVMDATHSAAYIVGIQKLYATSKYRLLVGAEITKTSESASNLLRGAGNWYVHGGDNGYTHANQIVGAGFGYGSDMTSLRVNYLPNSKNLSFLFQLEKISRDPNSFSSRWTDYIWQFTPRWRENRLQIMLPIQFIYSNSYLWKTNQKANNIFMRINLNYNL